MAEVLITLTIIGVIAAITIPNLIQSWRKHQVEASVKEAYSILNNALRLCESEYGSIGDNIANYANTSASAFSNYAQGEFTDKCLIPYLKIEKQAVAGYYNTLYSASKMGGLACLKSPTGSTPVNTSGYCTFGWRQLLLTNGMLIGIEAAYSYNPHIHIDFFVDINGPNNGPNRLGADVQTFSYHRTGSCSGKYSSCGKILQAGSALYEGMLYTGNANGHDADVKKCTQACTFFIQKNGWKIPDDYPVKKF